ncbi:hypothetical protein [Candidatus Uabimicrobium sp. HlEnr_7]|uniref:hypothetical protein n=1 Tax=Candidatus Uabimicrobium helgolandensis TaxID=3095367 RepID=UPI003558255F
MKIAIFGLGYVGKRLVTALKSHFKVTSYSTKTQIDNSFIFDATKKSEVQKISASKYDLTITTFPINNACIEYIDFLFATCSKNILLGSTGIYKRSSLGEIVTEKTPLLTEHKRYQSEINFIKRGGVILRLAGIYGKKRVPLNWLKSPRVGYCDKQLNLIHVNDIVEALQLMITQYPVDHVYNLSDGEKHTWKTIIDFAYHKKILDHKIDSVEINENSFVANDKFAQEYPQLKFNNLFEFLQNKGNNA